jgi:hypothetical protein
VRSTNSSASVAKCISLRSKKHNKVSSTRHLKGVVVLTTACPKTGPFGLDFAALRSYFQEAMAGRFGRRCEEEV